MVVDICDGTDGVLDRFRLMNNNIFVISTLKFTVTHMCASARAFSGANCWNFFLFRFYVIISMCAFCVKPLYREEKEVWCYYITVFDVLFVGSELFHNQRV